MMALLLALALPGFIEWDEICLDGKAFGPNRGLRPSVVCYEQDSGVVDRTLMLSRTFYPSNRPLSHKAGHPTHSTWTY